MSMRTIFVAIPRRLTAHDLPPYTGTIEKVTPYARAEWAPDVGFVSCPQGMSIAERWDLAIICAKEYLRNFDK
jgi:hypothetical protein